MTPHGVGQRGVCHFAVVSDSQGVFVGNRELAERDVPDYIDADHNKMKATFVRSPQLSDVPYPVLMEPNLVVEFYSR